MGLGVLVEKSFSIMEGTVFLDVTKITKLVVWTGGTEEDSQRRRYENFRLNRPSREKRI